MTPVRILCFLLAVARAAAFAPQAPKTFLAKESFDPFAMSSSPFDEAVAEYNSWQPKFAEWGWGPSVQAEKWNGRHAMAGWVIICASAYAKGHGLIPNADVPLSLAEWGTLATISGKNTITTERAVIFIANLHLFFVSLAATVAPNDYMDPLLLDPNDSSTKTIQSAKAVEAYGFLPQPKFGLTNEAEMINGRLAMVGISTVVGASFFTGRDIIDIVNEWVGGAYF
eukprot:CAMPEP_0172423136 /NCGR_PEP_ID=MMETSP1064-20121228/13379_1 /TAXON_ID=202472 /ORGANISM="Aulacoseira subarctica , Strain CCAP 1002/5" /LENGTH=225 /DNA_ID=CAMNT_0013164321 /DNA_START=81 /DNA_END=758 /DNA_ORIENTATION=+